MRCATFNVLADAYISYGDYSHVETDLLLPGARTQSILELVSSLQTDVIGLQEVEEPLVEAFKAMDEWQTFWTPKGNGKPDGCLMLLKHSIDADEFNTLNYNDGSGHVAQSLRIGRIIFANTHIKWAPTDAPDHIGVSQANELVKFIGSGQSAVIFADCNDRPGGPVRQVIGTAGFIHTHGNESTAVVNHEHVAIDLLAVRGIAFRTIDAGIDTNDIPSKRVPSDHIPLVIEV